MADKYDTGLLPRTYFKAPRVPFDFRALTLGIVGYLIFWLGGLLLSEICGRDDINGSFLMWFGSLFNGVPYIGSAVQSFLANVFMIDVGDASDYTFWHQLLGGAWFFFVWGYFGQAIHRITSLRIARDEGLSLGEALGFATKNFRQVLVAPVIIVGAMAFFYLCNSLAGLVTSIPLLGGVLGLIFIPLAIISTLLILLIGLGGVFGLPLIGAAAAWECNGSLDAISRAFSYVFARPLQYFWNFFLIFLFAGVILLVGAWFNYTLAKSVNFGTLSDAQTIILDAPAQGSEAYNDLDEDEQNMLEKLREANKKKGNTGTLRSPGQTRDFRGGSFARDFSAVTKAPWMYKLNAFLLWAFMNLVWITVFGYAVYWLLGASTSIYADLRADVDGTEEDEIFIEDEEETFDALADGGPTSEAGVDVAEQASAEATTEPTAEASDGSSDADGDAAEGAGGDDASDGDTPTEGD